MPRELDSLRERQLRTVPFRQTRWFKNHDFQTITLGTRIVVISSDGKERTLDLLGPLEAIYGRTNRPVLPISYESPLGKALLNQKAGDVVRLDNGLAFEILKTEQIILP